MNQEQSRPQRRQFYEYLIENGIQLRDGDTLKPRDLKETRFTLGTFRKYIRDFFTNEPKTEV